MATIFRQVLKQSVAANRTRLCSSNSADTAAKLAFTKEGMNKLVNTNKVVIFMKGNPEEPRCGFSNAVVQIMRMHGVQYDAHDVLQSDELRQGVKDFTEWPTIPQVFIGGEFIGGCDILLQMHQNGELIEQLKKTGIESQLLREAKDAVQSSSVQAKEKPK